MSSGWSLDGGCPSLRAEKSRRTLRKFAITLEMSPETEEGSEAEDTDGADSLAARGGVDSKDSALHPDV